MSTTRQTNVEAEAVRTGQADERNTARPSFADSLTQGERRLRWFLIGWMTLSTVLNLIDKNTLAILAPTLSELFDMSQADYARIIMAFQLAYATMYIVGGRFVDLVGEKIGMAACVTW